MNRKAKDGEDAAEKVVFSKKALMGTDRYAHRRDLLGVLLKTEKDYSFDEVDGLIETFMKGKVK